MTVGPRLRALGKKELQRERTRQELRRCALARFARHGFDKTSVADIVADAGVTERTFYRHFPTKESVLFEDLASRVGWFRAALAVRPPDEPLLESVRVARHGHRLDGSLATRQLGLDYTPVEETFSRTVDWFRATGLLT